MQGLQRLRRRKRCWPGCTTELRLVLPRARCKGARAALCAALPLHALLWVLPASPGGTRGRRCPKRSTGPGAPHRLRQRQGQGWQQQAGQRAHTRGLNCKLRPPAGGLRQLTRGRSRQAQPAEPRCIGLPPAWCCHRAEHLHGPGCHPSQAPPLPPTVVEPCHAGLLFSKAHPWGWPGTLCSARTGCCGRWRTCRCRWPTTTCAAAGTRQWWVVDGQVGTARAGGAGNRGMGHGRRGSGHGRGGAPQVARGQHLGNSRKPAERAQCGSVAEAAAKWVRPLPALPHDAAGARGAARHSHGHRIPLLDLKALAGGLGLALLLLRLLRLLHLHPW